MKMQKNSIQHEADEQEALFQWAEFQSAKYPELDLMYHIPNEGKRSKTTGAALKRQGLKSGVPDICLPVPRGKYHGLYIEMKYGNNKPTENQRKWLERLSGQGYKVAVCYDWISAAKVIFNYLEIKEKIY